MNTALLTKLDSAVPLGRACAVLGASRATHYRRTKPRQPRPPAPRESPRRLQDHERRAVLDVLHSQEFADQPPAEVHATLLDRGIYLASQRTFHRLLATVGESHERRNQRSPHPEPMPSLTATRPNEVWTWDISKLAGPIHGIFFALYVILDLYSRFVVRWMVAERESKALAGQLVTDACTELDIAPGFLTLHSDRGSPMKGIAGLLGVLGVHQSFGRPRVSNDNPFSEALFKTTKYQPDYPRRFGSLQHARAWLAEFFDWYCHHHQHSSLAYFTPADVFLGRVPDLVIRRQQALDAAYLHHPERFVRGRPIVRLPPRTVSINPPDSAIALVPPMVSDPS